MSGHRIGDGFGVMTDEQLAFVGSTSERLIVKQANAVGDVGLGLFGPTAPAEDLAPHGVGDELGRYYTPIALAREIVRRRVRELVLRGVERCLVADCSAGGGAFLTAARQLERSLGGDLVRISTVGIDIDERAAGREVTREHARSLADDEWIVGDWLDLDAFPVGFLRRNWIGHDRGTKPVIIVGNPPFPSGDVARQHVLRALQEQPSIVSLILPIEYVGRRSWVDLLDPNPSRPLYGMRFVGIEPVVQRPWPAHVRETACYTWHSVELEQRPAAGYAPLRWT